MACDLSGLTTRAHSSGVNNRTWWERLSLIAQALCELGDQVSVDASTVQSTGTDQRLTVDDTVGGVQLAALPAAATHALWDVQDAAIMVTFDGSAPTSTNGHELLPNDSYTWSKQLAEGAKFIRKGGTNGIFHMTPVRRV